MNITEALELKVRYGEDAMFTAGGTDLYPNMKRRQFTPRFLIGLRGIPELKMFEIDEGIRIGSGVSLAEVAGNSLIHEKFSALNMAAGLVSSPQLRTMGTLGGNLCIDTRCTYYNQNFSWRKALGFCLKKDGDICWVATKSPKCLAISSSDCVPVMLALGAELELRGPAGTRTLPAQEFYLDDGIGYLNKQPSELLVKISIPEMSGWNSSYRKLRRRGTIDFPVIGTAVAVRTDSAGICTNARIVLGSLASAPVVASSSAEMLLGSKPDQEKIEAVAIEAAKLAKPMDNTDMNLGYRKKIVSIFVARALQDAFGLMGNLKLK